MKIIFKFNQKNNKKIISFISPDGWGFVLFQYVDCAPNRNMKRENFYFS